MKRREKKRTWIPCQAGVWFTRLNETSSHRCTAALSDFSVFQKYWFPLRDNGISMDLATGGLWGDKQKPHSHIALFLTLWGVSNVHLQKTFGLERLFSYLWGSNESCWTVKHLRRSLQPPGLNSQNWAAVYCSRTHVTSRSCSQTLWQPDPLISDESDSTGWRETHRKSKTTEMPASVDNRPVLVEPDVPVFL